MFLYQLMINDFYVYGEVRWGCARQVALPCCAHRSTEDPEAMPLHQQTTINQHQDYKTSCNTMNLSINLKSSEAICFLLLYFRIIKTSKKSHDSPIPLLFQTGTRPWPHPKGSSQSPVCSSCLQIFVRAKSGRVCNSPLSGKVQGQDEAEYCFVMYNIEIFFT